MEQNLLKEKRKNRNKEFWFIFSLIVFPMVNFLVFYVYLNASSYVLAFQKIDAKTLDKTWVGFENFVNLFKAFSTSGSDYLNALGNSLLSYVLGMVISFPLEILFAFYVYKKALGSGIFRFVVLIPQVLSGVLMAMMFKRFAYALPNFMRGIGFDNFPNIMSDPSYTFFITIYFGLWGGFGMSTIMYGNAMNSVSDEIVESAVLDGINYVRELWSITLPLIMPTISTFIITSVSTFLTAEGPLFLFWEYQAPRETVRLGYLMFQTTMKAGESTYPEVAALGMLCTMITFPLTMFVRWLFEKFDPMN